MRLSLAIAAPLLVACAHPGEDGLEPRSPADHRGAELASSEALVVDRAEAPPAEAPPARPRLSRTITLGQGAAPTYTPTAPRPAPTAGPVVVNNNQVIVRGAPVYAGYGGYRAYGGYGRPSTYSYGRGDGARGASRAAAPSWGSSGWEGARRTAAPGQTPGVGGNWAPAPSYGPAPMK